MDPIVVVNEFPEIVTDLLNNKITFKFIEYTSAEDSRDLGIAYTKKDYEDRLSSHRYSGLLFASKIETRIAYLFGLLNKDYYYTSNAKVVCYIRGIGTPEWQEWFYIRPYVNNFYC